MLKKFFLIVCGSFVGTFLALFFAILTAVFVSFAIFGSMSSTGVTANVEKNSLLYLKLSGSLEERSGGAQPSMASLMSMMPGKEQGMSLSTAIKSLALAKEDKNIKGVYVDCRGIAAGMSSLYELRVALEDFKKCKKFVYAYGDGEISQGDYYLASVADSIFLNPQGAVDVHGLESKQPYMKNLLDKVGVEMQVVRVGTFKSAVEPYILDHMSEANRLQQEHYLGNLWKEISAAMAKSRGIAPAAFQTLTDSIMVTKSAEEQVKLKLVDGLCFRTEMEDKLRALTDVDRDEDLKLVSPAELVSSSDDIAIGGDQVAVLYATGEIDGSSSIPGMNSDGIDSESLSQVIRELQYDDDVKALVLRVNSPGGSAFGSEVIWKALEDFKSSGKPFAVSMSDYAASGGYYISSGADRIFAEPVTITGSIGIFGMIPCVSKFANNTLGVNFDGVKTADNAGVGSMYEPLTDYQRASLQSMVERGYDTFTTRCATGRGVSQDSIKAIAEGRVWDGVTAKSINLVDEFGGLNDAVKWVAKKAKLKTGKYAVVDYPNIETSFLDMLNSMQALRLESDMKSRMGMFYSYYEQLQAILGRKHVLCLMEPIDIEL